MRALAVLLVVVFHADLPLPGGYVGVDVFFVISGFVITRLLVRELAGSDRLRFRSFYSRRVKRLLPALALVLAVVAVLSLVALSPLGTQRTAAKTAIASALFSANIQLAHSAAGYFDAPSTANPLLHMWSLGVEEQFYLVFPLAIALAWRFGRKSRRLTPARATAIALVVGGAASFLYGVLQTNRVATHAFYSSPARAWEFAVGALLALVDQAGPQRLRPWLANIIVAVGLAMVVVAARVDTGTTRFPGTAALLPVLGAAFVLAGGAATAGGLSRLLGARAAVWIGDRSYGWYLWHWPAVVYARLLWPTIGWLVPVAAAVSIVPAALSYTLLEERIRRDGRVIGKRAFRLAAVCVSVPLASWALVWGLTPVQRDSGPINEVASQWRRHGGPGPNCLTRVTPNGAQNPAHGCGPLGATANPHGAFALIGDSNAQHFIEGATKAAANTDMDLLVAWRQGCPFADLYAIADSSTPGGLQSCRYFVRQSTQAIVALHPRVVFVAAASIEYITLDRVDLRRNRVAARSPAEKAALWRAGLRAVVKQFTDAGIPTVVIHPVPNFDHFDGNLCPAARLYLDAASCGERLPNARIEAQRRLPLRAEREAIKHIPLASSTDFTRDVCNRSFCATETAGTWIYRDAAHLSVDGSLRLARQFAALVRSSAGLVAS